MQIVWERDGGRDSFNFPFEILPLHQIRDLIVVFIVALLARGPFTPRALFLLHALVALSQSPQTCERVWAQLVENPGNQFGEFLVLAVAVDREGVRGDGGVD